jgi:hypothetical protein
MAPPRARKRDSGTLHVGNHAADPGRRLMVLVDANVLLDVLTDDPDWRIWSEVINARCGTLSHLFPTRRSYRARLIERRPQNLPC